MTPDVPRCDWHVNGDETTCGRPAVFRAFYYAPGKPREECAGCKRHGKVRLELLRSLEWIVYEEAQA